MTVFGLCRNERERERERKKKHLAISEIQKQPFVSTSRTHAHECGAASVVLSRSFCGK